MDKRSLSIGRVIEFPRLSENTEYEYIHDYKLVDMNNPCIETFHMNIVLKVFPSEYKVICYNQSKLAQLEIFAFSKKKKGVIVVARLLSETCWMHTR